MVTAPSWHRKKWEKNRAYFSTNKVAKWWKPTKVTEEIREWILINNHWKDQRVLELGSGNGDMLRLIRDKGAIVTGLDLCPAMIKQCDGLDVKMGNACNIPFPDNTFNVVIAIESFMHFDSQKKALEEIARVLKPKGIVFIQADELFHYSIFKKIPYYIANVLRYGSKLEHKNTVNGLKMMFEEASLQAIKTQYFAGKKKFCIQGLIV